MEKNLVQSRQSILLCDIISYKIKLKKGKWRYSFVLLKACGLTPSQYRNKEGDSGLSGLNL